jgi:hypothetical protein
MEKKTCGVSCGGRKYYCVSKKKEKQKQQQKKKGLWMPFVHETERLDH